MVTVKVCSKNDTLIVLLGAPFIEVASTEWDQCNYHQSTWKCGETIESKDRQSRKIVIQVENRGSTFETTFPSSSACDNEGFPHFAVLTEFVLNDVYYENI